MSASEKGYTSGSGQGAGLSHASGGSGASHGGLGGSGTHTGYASQAYGSVFNPVEYGSGGGTTAAVADGTGGGILRLNASGYVDVDGEIRADGGEATSVGVGGGSGGSIWINAETFKGKAEI